MGKLTISMVIFNSYVNVYHGWYPILIHIPVVPLNCLRTQWLKHGVKAHQGVANSSQIHRQRKERVATWSTKKWWPWFTGIHGEAPER